MIRRFNRTGRDPIDKAHAQVSVRPSENGDAPIFDLRLQLDSYDFDPDAIVRVEASRRLTVQRWNFGTVGALTPPPDEERRLTDVPVGASFRVFIVEPGGTGKLLGHAPRIQPILPVKSLLPLRESDALGEEVWRVDFGGGDDLPVLLVNRRIPGIGEIVGSDAGFRALVLPELLRTILTHLVLIERIDTEDDGPATKWLNLARSHDPKRREAPSLRPAAAVEEVESARDWIREVVEAFATKKVKAAPSYADFQEARS